MKAALAELEYVKERQVVLVAPAAPEASVAQVVLEASEVPAVQVVSVLLAVPEGGESAKAALLASAAPAARAASVAQVGLEVSEAPAVQVALELRGGRAHTAALEMRVVSALLVALEGAESSEAVLSLVVLAVLEEVPVEVARAAALVSLASRAIQVVAVLPVAPALGGQVVARAAADPPGAAPAGVALVEVSAIDFQCADPAVVVPLAAPAEAARLANQEGSVDGPSLGQMLGEPQEAAGADLGPEPREAGFPGT